MLVCDTLSENWHLDKTFPGKQTNTHRLSKHTRTYNGGRRIPKWHTVLWGQQNKWFSFSWCFIYCHVRFSSWEESWACLLVLCTLVCVRVNSLCRSWVCSSLWQEPFVTFTKCPQWRGPILSLIMRPNEASASALPILSLIYCFSLTNEICRLHEEHLRVLITPCPRKTAGWIPLLRQQKAPGSHAWMFLPFPPWEDEGHQNTHHSPSPFSEAL